MRNYKKTILIIIALLNSLMFLNYAFAKVKNVTELSNLQIIEVFINLHELEYINNDKELKNAVYEAFKKRKQEAINYSINELSNPIIEFDGEVAKPNYNYDIAKKVLYTFPNQSKAPLIKAYKSNDPLMKANAIRIMGSMVGIIDFRKYLIEALDDERICEENELIDVAFSMRVCDVAYNQIVLRYKIRNVLRSIGNMHSIDIRNYHIGILKNNY